jgi:hypothetical protein
MSAAALPINPASLDPYQIDISMPAIDYLHQLQWPAMVVTVLAAWLVASQSKRRRLAGFWSFLLSNVLWVIWGWHDNAYALIALQIALAILNFRGAYKNDPKTGGESGG